MPFDQDPIQGYDNWNLNAPYMTPAYMANFRPTYQGDGALNPWNTNYTLGQSANAAFVSQMGDQGGVPFGGNTLGFASRHRYNMATAPGDALMQGMQSAAIPLASWYVASKLMRGDAIGGALGRGGARAGLGVAGYMARKAGLGGVASTLGRMGVGRAAVGMAGFAGSMALAPMLMAPAIASAANEALIDPYVAMRRTNESFQANTYNQALSGGSSVTGGFGMSAMHAHKLSQAIVKAGQGDMALNGNDYGQIADNMMQAGMFREVGDMDSNKIVEGVKKAASVLKLITRITGDPDIQAGVKTLATLKSGGLEDIDEMGRALQKVRNASAKSGVSVNQLMDTVGNQGMVMAQQYGMRGATGMLASINTYGGLANAMKSGIISEAQIQALGGLEGMTQNVMSGAMKTISSPITQVQLQTGAAPGTSTVDSLSSFAQNVATDAMATSGDMILNSSIYADRSLKKYGAVQTTILQAKQRAREMRKDPNDVRVLASIMSKYLHLNNDEIRSTLEYAKSAVSVKGQLRSSLVGYKASVNDMSSELEQDGMGFVGTPYIGAGLLSARRLWRSAKQGFSNVGSEMDKLGSEGSDYWTETETKNVKGLNLDIDRPVYAKEGSKELLYTMKSMHIPEYNYNGSINRGTKKVHDKSFDKTIGNLNAMAQAASPENRKKIVEAYKLLHEGTERSRRKAADILYDLDKDSGGLLSNTKTGYDQYHADVTRRKAIMDGDFVVTARDVTGNEVTNTGDIEDNKFLKLISKAEADPSKGYDSVHSKSHFSKGFKPTESTIGMVLEEQAKSIKSGKSLNKDGKGYSAVGKFQFLRSTIQHLLKKGVINRTDVMDEETQIKMAQSLMSEKPAIMRLVNAKPHEVTDKMRKEAAQAIATIWASFPGLKGLNPAASVYAGDGRNAASIPIAEAMESTYHVRSFMKHEAGTKNTHNSTYGVESILRKSTLGDDVSDKNSLWDLFGKKSMHTNEMYNYLGVTSKDTKGLSPNALRSLLTNKALGKMNAQVSDVKDIGDLANRIYKRAGGSLTKNQIYKSLSIASDATNLKRINATGGNFDVNTNLNDMTKDIIKDNPAKEDTGMFKGLDFSGMKDLNDGVGTLKDGVKENTDALNDLTKILKSPSKGSVAMNLFKTPTV